VFFRFTNCFSRAGREHAPDSQRESHQLLALNRPQIDRLPCGCFVDSSRQNPRAVLVRMLPDPP
jgi:hypothetical protein